LTDTAISPSNLPSVLERRRATAKNRSPPRRLSVGWLTCSTSDFSST
jgi:hypothetical protein